MNARGECRLSVFLQGCVFMVTIPLILVISEPQLHRRIEEIRGSITSKNEIFLLS